MMKISDGKIKEELAQRRWVKRRGHAVWFKGTYRNDAGELIPRLSLAPLDPTNLQGTWIRTSSDPGSATLLKTWASPTAMFQDGAAESPAV